MGVIVTLRTCRPVRACMWVGGWVDTLMNDKEKE